MNKEFEELLEAAKLHVMTPRELWLQRVSFTYGQLMDDPTVTREMVEAVATLKYGPCPPESTTS